MHEGSSNRAGAGTIVDVVGAEPGVWSVIVVPQEDIDKTASELAEEYDFAVGESGMGTAKLLDAHTMHDVLKLLKQTRPEDICILKGIETWQNAQLEALDLHRNTLADRARVAIVTTAAGATRLRELAPNIWSWIGSRCFEFAASIGVMDKEARLTSLRKFFNLSDGDVIRQAEMGELPTEPAFAEWLILLGKDDLLGK